MLRSTPHSWLKNPLVRLQPPSVDLFHFFKVYLVFVLWFDLCCSCITGPPGSTASCECVAGYRGNGTHCEGQTDTTHVYVAPRLENINQNDSIMVFVSQRWTCAARLMVGVQNLPPVPKYQQGREAVPVKTATLATGPCAWVIIRPRCSIDIQSM